MLDIQQGQPEKIDESLSGCRGIASTGLVHNELGGDQLLFRPLPMPPLPRQCLPRHERGRRRLIALSGSRVIDASM